MPKSKPKSKSTALAAYSGGLPRHPALNAPNPLLAYRQGSEAEFRLPDAYNKPTAAKVLRSDYTITSDAAGIAVWGEHYRLARFGYVVTAGVTAASVTLTNVPQYAAFTSESRLARVIGHRIVITYIGAAQEAAGYLSVASKAQTADSTSVSVDSLHSGSDRQVRATEGLVVYNDFSQEPRWEAPADTSFMYGTYATQVFAASGLPANKDVFRVRVVRFLEYQPAEGTLSESDLGHEPHDPAALAVHGELSGPNTSIYTHAEAPSFWQRVSSAANAAYHVAQPLLTNYVVPQARSFLKNQAMTAFEAALPLLTL